MVKLLDKADWMVRLDHYPHILESSGYYTHNMNILGNDRTVEYGHWYNPIAKAVLKNLKGKKIPFPFDIYIDKGNVDSVPEDRLFSIYSFFICYLQNPMKKKFGEPLYHSFWGEGFDDKKNFEYASWFLESNGVSLHIGYDHRGSSIEVDDSKTPQEICDALIELANHLYK